MFNTDKGFGFIKPDDGGNDVSIHVSELQRSGIKFVMEGDRLSFQMGLGKTAVWQLPKSPPWPVNEGYRRLRRASIDGMIVSVRF